MAGVGEVVAVEEAADLAAAVVLAWAVVACRGPRPRSAVRRRLAGPRRHHVRPAEFRDHQSALARADPLEARGAWTRPYFRHPGAQRLPEGDPGMSAEQWAETKKMWSCWD